MSLCSQVRIWLHLILALWSRAIEAQSSLQRRSISNGDSGGGSSGFGHRHGFRKGGYFGNGRKEGQQNENQTATDDLTVEAGGSGVYAPASYSPPYEPGLAPTSTSVTGTKGTLALSEATSSPIAISPTTVETSKLFTDVGYETLEIEPTPAPIPGVTSHIFPSSSALSQSLPLMILPAIWHSLGPVPSHTMSLLTVTTSSTVYVTLSTAAVAEEKPFSTIITQASMDTSTGTSTQTPTQTATQTPAQASALDPTPLPSSSVAPFGPGQKAGIGVGITVAALAVFGSIAFVLYRRRRRSHERTGSPTGSQNSESPFRNRGLTNFLGPRRSPEEKYDPEWTIESAKQVQIVRAGSVRSVVSQARSVTPPLPRHTHFPNDGDLPNGGTSVSEREPALRSSPALSLGSVHSLPRSGEIGTWPLQD